MPRVSRFAFITLSIVVLAVFGNVSPAFADRPYREELLFDPFAITDECDFDVLFEPLSNKEKLTVFFDKEGNVRFVNITGVLKVRMTNMDTGTSVDLNISGPLRIDPQADGSTRITYRGPGGLWFPPNDSNLPPIAFTHGPVVTEVDPDGNFSVISVKGHVEDVCAMLSDV